MREQLLCYSIRYLGDWNKIASAIITSEPWDYIEYNGNYTTIFDDDYPYSLRELAYAPWVIFFQGDMSLLNRSAISIVGSRICDAYGIKMCSKITRKLKERYVIVSGLAKGIDGCAHKESLDSGTIGILGNGIDVIYPKENINLYQEMKDHHLILSEYPKGTPPLAKHFPWRNRIIVALGESLIVVEARIKSGTMGSVNEALTLSIPIYVVPHRYDDELGKGCNLLISQGANILIDEQDIDNI